MPQLPQLHAQPTHSPSLTPTHTPTHTPTLFPTANPSSSPTIKTCPADLGNTCTEQSDCCQIPFPETCSASLVCWNRRSDNPVTEVNCTMICTDPVNQTKKEEDCAGLGIDSANIGCRAYDTSYCTVESRTNAGQCDES